MELDNIVVKMGQFWQHNSCPHIKYEVVEITASRELFWVYAVEFVNGRMKRTRCSLGMVDRNYKPQNWMPGWELLPKTPKVQRFSRINQRALRKRIREQIAASSLTDKS